MIGVIADPAEADVVREFFELFKTPWEFYRRVNGMTFCSVRTIGRSKPPRTF